MKNIKIIEEKENPLFNRKEIQIEVNSEVVPSHQEVEKIITEKFSTNVENIKIKKIHGKFGSNNFIITTNIYKTPQDKERIEPKSKKEKQSTPAS